MGIEKISNSGTMAYQGSAAMSQVSGTEAVSQSTDAVLQFSGQTVPDLSLEQRSNEGTGTRAEDQGTGQSAQLKSAVSDLNKQMKNSEAVFGIHDKTNRVTIKIVDKTTKEVIKEFPPEETLDMIAKVWEVAGILVDEKR